ncbi:MAG: hypothetical protein KF681_06430 [Bdellovibrionaceae bacterium]|nr:hypothetical protein [Pseudobdellovibrionaceae bacterium]
MKTNTPQTHEKLFDEISGKLNELSQKSDLQSKQDLWSERLEKMQYNLRISQEELKATQTELQAKIRSMDALGGSQNDMNQEIKKIAEQLEQERMANSKISTDLAKSLELNLKLQFDLEEIRTKANNMVVEERKMNQFLSEKNRTALAELDLAQALQNETRLELSKAKDRFQLENEQWQQQRKNLEARIKDLEVQADSRALEMDEKELALKSHLEEINRLNDILGQFESHAVQQNGVLKNLSDVAEKKLIELKLALDKKTIESHDYYNHLQQALTQIQVLRQENAALKDYIAKLSNLHQTRTPEIRA